MDQSIEIIDDDDDFEVANAIIPLPPSPRTTRATVGQTTPNGNVASSISTTEDSPLLSVKKRKRAIFTPSPKTQKSPKPPPLVEEDDDGATCPICLDSWEMSGDHRLTSLKCGHLFGQSCIRRWLQECATGSKCCPSCKTKATARDFRFLYAKRLCVIDNTETVMLKDLLAESRSEVMKLTTEKSLLDFEVGHHRHKVLNLQEEINYLRGKLANPSAAVSSSQQDMDVSLQRLSRLKKVKLFLEKNMDIGREGGCRCMTSSRSERLLFVNQKSSQSLFPGYGIRYIDLETMKPMNYLHVSGKQIRDLVVTDNIENQPNFLLTATMETSGRLYDVSTRALVQTYKPVSTTGAPDKPLWCCAHEDSNAVWFGGQQGSVFQFDKRNPSQQRLEFLASTEPSPLINVVHIPSDPSTLPFGGLLVCSLKDLVFFQFTDSGQQQRRTLPINIDGPFSSMAYDRMTGYVLVTTRSSKKFPHARYILGRFERAPGLDVAMLVVKQTFLGSDVMPVMSRPTQYHVYGTDSVLMSAYLQSTKMLTTWAVENNLKLQSLSVSDTILDMCPVYISGVQHLAALSDNRCRIFKIHEDRL